MKRRVIAAFNTTIPHRYLDDGSEWVYDINGSGEWSQRVPPLPPEVLGETSGTFQVGDKVRFEMDDLKLTGEVHKLFDNGDVLVIWHWNQTHIGRAIFPSSKLTKVNE